MSHVDHATKLERAATAWQAREADACVARAEQLQQQGRLPEAERTLGLALDLDPGHVAATTLLVRVLIAQKKTSKACQAIDALAAAGQVPAELLLLHGQLLLAAERFRDAVDVMKRAVAALPASASAELGLAVALGETGSNEGAATAARNAIRKGADSPGARYVLGRALFGSNRLEEAEVEFRNVIQAEPAHVDAHTNLADVVWMRTGDLDATTAELDVALRKIPDSVALRVLRSRLLEAAGQGERAYAGIVEAPGTTPNAELELAAAHVSIATDAPRALAHAERALRLAPTHRGTLEMYGDALLANGHANRLVPIAEQLLRANPEDGHAIALLASAWRLLGDRRYRALYDYERFVRASLIDTPDGWPDLESYLRDLARCLHDRHDALRAHPVMQTLRAGTQISLRLDDSADAPVRALGQAIEGPIRRYLDAIGTGGDRLRKRNTGAWQLDGMWSVRLRDGGFHLDHYHGNGWLSSACYIELPATSSRDGSGWLRFGAPYMPTATPLPPEYFVRPEPGLLVLFPSWMWHGTQPFVAGAGETRLTVAFDVVPA